MGVGVALLGQDSMHPLPIQSLIETCVKKMIHEDLEKEISQNLVCMKAVVRKVAEPNGSLRRSLSKLMEWL